MPPPPLIHWALVGCVVLLVILAITSAVVVTRAVLHQRRRPSERQPHDPGQLDTPRGDQS